MKRSRLLFSSFCLAALTASAGVFDDVDFKGDRLPGEGVR